MTTSAPILTISHDTATSQGFLFFIYLFKLDHGPLCMCTHGREHFCLSRRAQFNRSDVSTGDMH